MKHVVWFANKMGVLGEKEEETPQEEASLSIEETK